MKPLCYAPFTALYVSTRSGYGPCCVSKKFKASDPESFWVGPEMQDIRKQLLDGKFPDSCRMCSNRSAHGVTSDVDGWNHLHRQYPININVETGNETGGPIHVDYRPSNLCNLKCRMCGTYASSLIAEEVENNEELLEWHKKPTEAEDYNSMMDEYVSKLDLVSIKILGGEPTIDPKVIEFMNIASKSEPDLIITTNATNVNARFKEVARKFKNIKVAISLDATHEMYEYIRTNANWKKTEENVKKLMEEFPKASFCFNVVLTPWSLLSLDKTLRWMQDLKSSGKRFSVFITDSDDPHTGMPAALPGHIEQALNDIPYEVFDDLECVNTIAILNSAKFDEKSHKSFKRMNAALDKVRKTDASLVDPRMKEYM